MFARFRPSVVQFSCLRNPSRSVASIEQQQTKQTLLQNGFSEEQSEGLVAHLTNYLRQDSPKLVHSSLDCWRKNLRSSKTEIDTSDQLFAEVFLTKEPRLLLMQPDQILQRIDALRSLDLVRGRNDLWTLFRQAPAGYYLQDWNEFLRKYYYLTYKVLPWLEPKIAHDAVNPLLKCPPVMEHTFNTIKTRFIFVQRTGFKSSLGGKNPRQVNLKTLIMCPVNEFLYKFSPHCTLEEYNALEKLNAHSTGEEDDKLFEDLVELAPKVSKRSFIDSNLKESYLISDIRQ